MRFIVIGAGEVGTSLCRHLAGEQKHDVILIERHEANLNKAAANLDAEILLGNGCSPEMLVRAGIQTADYVIAVASIDEVNITACLAAKLLNPAAKRIARIRDLSFVHKEISPERVNDYFDLIINPDQAASDYLLQLFKVPGAKEIVDFCEGKLRVIGIPVAARSPIAGRQLVTMAELQEQFPVLIIAIVRRGKITVPRGQDVIQPGDLVYCITIPEKTRLLLEMAGVPQSEGRSAIVWGGNALGKILTHALEDEGSQVKLIVSEEESSLEMVDEFKSALVLVGEGTDQNLLREENIGDTDAFIAVTSDDEYNILSSLLAKNLGVSMSMALVNKPTYLAIMNALGIDAVVSSRLAAASSIFGHIHSESVVSEFSLRELGAGFIEVIATDQMPIVGKPLNEIKAPHGIIFGAIVREDQIIIPRGTDIVQANDRLVVFVKSGAHRKLEKLLDLKMEIFI